MLESYRNLSKGIRNPINYMYSLRGSLAVCTVDSMYTQISRSLYETPHLALRLKLNFSIRFADYIFPTSRFQCDIYLLFI